MNCTFVDNNRINIGNNVLIASDVKIYTATHTTDVAGRTNTPANKKYPVASAVLTQSL